MISFELTEAARAARDHFHRMAEERMRPISRKYDELEHEFPREWVDWYWNEGRKGGPFVRGPGDGMVQVCMQAEELCWGDAGLYLRTPFAGLGGSAVAAAGTKEQKARFLSVFQGDGPPAWGAMAITEPGAGSDSAAIETTATLDGEEWVLNGTKIFCTGGEGAATAPGGFVVVWATVDKRAGRGGIKAFVVPAGTPGMTLVGLEKKLGIRASDTATLRFENCRVPKANLLGSAEVKRGEKGSSKGLGAGEAAEERPAQRAEGERSSSKGLGAGEATEERPAQRAEGERSSSKGLGAGEAAEERPAQRGEAERSSGQGFKGAMATFDASRPIVAAMAVGVGRAALDFLKQELAREGVVVRYEAPSTELSALERDVIQMEAELQAARLLTWRAAAMMNRGKPNNLEASMAKAKAGLAVTKITQKAVEWLGPRGYSKRLLVEKWMRDAKINDIYEGTQQINLLIVARRILDYSSSMLR